MFIASLTILRWSSKPKIMKERCGGYDTNIDTTNTDFHHFPLSFCCAREVEWVYQKNLHLNDVASPYSAGKSQEKVFHH